MLRIIIVVMTMCFILISAQYSYAIKPENNMRSIDRIIDAYEEGKITIDEQILMRFQAIYSPDKLPLEFQTHSNKNVYEFNDSLTILFGDIVRAWDRLSPATRKLAKESFLRPTDSTYSYTSVNYTYGPYTSTPRAYTTSHFRIHYVDPIENPNDDDRVSSVYSATPGIEGVPVYVENLSNDLEQNYDTYFNTWGFLPPEPDGEEGNDTTEWNGAAISGPFIDIYLRDLKNKFSGVSIVPFSECPTMPTNCPTFIIMDNDYSPIDEYFSGVTPEQMRKSVAAHELFHAYQNGYHAGQTTYLRESTAEWAAEKSVSNNKFSLKMLEAWLSVPYLQLDVPYGNSPPQGISFAENHYF